LFQFYKDSLPIESSKPSHIFNLIRRRSIKGTMLRLTSHSLLLILACMSTTHAFSVRHYTQRSLPSTTTTTTALFYDSHHRKDDHDSLDTVLRERLNHMRRQMMEEEYRMPPNPRLSASEFVTELLTALWHNSEPLPDSGFRCLLRSSTGRWRHALFDSIGAPTTATEEQVASALGEAMGRPRNQFGLLVGEAEHYVPTFPSEPLDYADGTCWLECRLWNKKDNQLLVVTGWQLEQRKADGAWLVDRIDWQDFRDEYRPGIGREEWMRICG
jgi:hypothetical protein